MTTTPTHDANGRPLIGHHADGLSPFHDTETETAMDGRGPRGP